MTFASVRDFKTNATKYLKGRDPVYITRRGKPVAILTPVRPKSTEAVLIEMERIFAEAGITKKEAAAALDEARRKVYRR